MRRPISLLDGPYAAEWEALGLGILSVTHVAGGAHASHRATTSSRTPGRVNVGTVYRSAVKPREIHICRCGQKQHQCPSCLAWICEADGHAKHVCGSDW